MQNVNPDSTPDMLYQNIQETLINVSRSCLGRQITDSNKNWRITDETVESIQLKKEIRKTLGSDSVLYKLHRNNVKRLCRIDIERSIDQQHDIVQSQPPSQQYFEAIKRTKETSKSKRKCWNVKSESGKIITEREDVIKRWTEYYQKLYSDQRPNSLIRYRYNDINEIQSITYLSWL